MPVEILHFDQKCHVTDRLEEDVKMPGNGRGWGGSWVERATLSLRAMESWGICFKNAYHPATHSVLYVARLSPMDMRVERP